MKVCANFQISVELIPFLYCFKWKKADCAKAVPCLGMLHPLLEVNLVALLICSESRTKLFRGGKAALWIILNSKRTSEYTINLSKFNITRKYRAVVILS